MKIGFFGLGKMGANMVKRLMRQGHECVVFNRSPEKVRQLAAAGAIAAESIADLVSKLPQPRTIWLMVPAGEPTETAIVEVAKLLVPGDTIVDGGNTHYIDDIRRARELAPQGINYVDVGTSGGVWGLERGYCLMIGGDPEVVKHLEPIFQTLAPGNPSSQCLKDRQVTTSTASQGYLHCGHHGSGHLCKAVHNAVEYALLAGYAEGFNVLKHSNIGRQERTANAETTPLRHPEHYQYDFDLPAIAELWRHGSVIGSWLLDLTAIALQADPQLSQFAGKVADSGEGRWTVMAAIEQGTPVPVISASLYQRFASRGEDEFALKLLSALRYQFGGHIEQQ